MREFDLVIRGGTVVEGTGVPRYKADVGIKNGRVAVISGGIPAGAAKEIDASGCIVAPGAIDIHTHYDAQLNWDPYASLSGWFGATSVSIGECGFGFAPTRPEDRELNMRMMDRIEAIPLESMRRGMRWDWETFPEYLDSLDRQGLGLNVAAQVPFSPLRGYVLGMLPARERTSMTEAELRRMKELFHESMKAGGFGFSADKQLIDRPEDGGYLPSHMASNEEYLALAEIMGEFGVGHIGWTISLKGQTGEDRAGEWKLLEAMMRRSGRPLVAAAVGKDMDVLERLRAQGLPIVAQQFCMSPKTTYTLAEYNLFDYMPSWVKPLVGTAEERAAKLRDPQVRAAMKRDYEHQVKNGLTNLADWNKVRVTEVVNDRNQAHEGLTIREMAARQQKDPLDAFLDLALEEGLRTVFSAPAVGEQPDDVLGPKIKHPYTHISASDGGAHTRFFTFATWPVHFLTYWVRDRALMTLEEAHHKMSAYPAWLLGFKDRGSLRVGAWADIVVYDLERLGFLYERPVYANDFPGGERRFIQKPKGLRYILVNGAVTFEENRCTGALPGKLLRSYEMAA